MENIKSKSTENGSAKGIYKQKQKKYDDNSQVGTSKVKSNRERKRNRRRIRQRGTTKTVQSEEDIEIDVDIELQKLNLDPTFSNCSYGNVKDQLEAQNELLTEIVIVNSNDEIPKNIVKNDVPKKEKKTKTLVFVNKSFEKPSHVQENQKKNNEKKIPKSNIKAEKESEVVFTKYWSEVDVQKGLESGQLIKGNIRINPKDYKRAYITNPETEEHDIMIDSLQDRNRALEGDLVVVKLKPTPECINPNQKCGVVVYIEEKVHSRLAIGILKLMTDKNKQFALFHPRDSKIPRMKISFTDWPPLFYDEAAKYENVMFLAKLKEWRSKFAIGTLLENIGVSKDIRVQTKAILLENDLDIRPYTEEIKQYLPQTGDIPKEEFSYREDIRHECVFTIDPLTARDLDDAVSVKELSNGNFEIGVHISDVTYYLKEETLLNSLVSKRGTSIYMVESVYHMLPKELCMLCSLLPGEDKLTFSVFWEMTPDANVVSERFVRTIVNSCSQFAYEHAQSVIDDPNSDLNLKNFPQIHNGFTPDDLAKRILILNKLAVIMRKRRFDSGSLKIDQLKVLFSINPETFLPVSYTLYENKDCHRLIEEFMLLANVTVAKRLYDDYPAIAFLRAHPPPKKVMVNNLKSMLENVGIFLNTYSAGNLQESLLQYSGDDEISRVRMMVLNHLCAKTMTRAHYYCVSLTDDTWHYALNVPLYTHFTSPIRRYADCMVHRLLSGSMGYTEKPKWNPKNVDDIVKNCNLKKMKAKNAGDQSIEMYMSFYIAQNQPLETKAVVVCVKSLSFDALITDSGINNLEKGTTYQLLKDGPEQEEDDSNDIKRMLIVWPEKDSLPAVQQVVSMFTVVSVKLTAKGKALKPNAQLLRPVR